MENTENSTEHTDLIIVGAGIIGLAHAVEARRRGLSVRILDRDARAVGASVRNFGHACITAQGGPEQQMAQESRRGWLAAAAEIGFWAPEAGAVVVARTPAEMAVLEEFRDDRGEEASRLLTAEDVRARLGGATRDVVGGAFLPADLRVDPRTTAGRIAAWLETQPEVAVHWSTPVTGAADGVVSTPEAEYTAEQVIVCVGHDIDRLYPSIARTWQIVRCALQMASTDPLPGFELDAAVLTGTSMLRYDGLAAMPSAGRVRGDLEARSPELLAMVANVMLTRRPDGSVLVGDSHVYDETTAPFLDEGVSQRLLEEIAGLLGVTALPVRQRWQGVYASSALTNVVAERPDARTLVTSVTSGIGMTLGFGLARRTLDSL